MLDAAQRGAIDVVMVQRLDRWGRSTLDLLANLRRLRSAGVGFVAIAQGLEVRPQHDAVSDLTLTVLAAVAEFERAVIVDRTLDGLAAARRAGKKIGRPIGKSAPAPDRVAALRAAGRSWTAIARRLRCTVGSARRALVRGLPKPGARPRARRSVGTAAAQPALPKRIGFGARQGGLDERAAAVVGWWAMARRNRRWVSATRIERS